MKKAGNKVKKPFNLELNLFYIFSGFFLILASLTKIGFFNSLDKAFDLAFRNFSSPVLEKISLFIAFVFDPVPMIVLSLIVVGILYLFKLKKEATFLLIGTSLAGILIILFKEIIGRVRPENLLETNYSFPSGHATIALVFILSLFFIFHHKLKLRNTFLAGLLVVISFIGFSRMYLHVHWFTDIIGGFLLGLGILSFGVFITKKYIR